MKKLRLREVTETVNSRAGIQVVGLDLESVLDDKVKTGMPKKRYK